MGLPNADEQLLKAQFVSEIIDVKKRRKLAQSEVAALTDTVQLDLSNLLRGRFRGFFIERLMQMLNAFRREVEVVTRPAPRSRKHGGISFGNEAV